MIAGLENSITEFSGKKFTLYGVRGGIYSFPGETEGSLSNRPTTRQWGKGGMHGNSEDSQLMGDYSIGWKERMKAGLLGGRIVKYPAQRKRALRYINELKKLGRETGEELRVELEKKESLERKVGLIVTISGLLLSILFFSYNLTGNAIASINQKSSNWIGWVLFLIGLIGAFAYFKKK